MGYARYIGRVGALAAALGVATLVANTPGVALADESGASSQSNSASSSATSSSGTTPQDGPADPAAAAGLDASNPPGSTPAAPSNTPSASTVSGQAPPTQTTGESDTGPETSWSSSGGALSSSTHTENSETPQDEVTTENAPADEEPAATPPQPEVLPDPPASTLSASIESVDPGSAESAAPDPTQSAPSHPAPPVAPTEATLSLENDPLDVSPPLQQHAIADLETVEGPSATAALVAATDPSAALLTSAEEPAGVEELTTAAVETPTPLFSGR